ncbi:MAG: FGGY-family carbohydrate kinase [Ostreibacterium sp.]
MSQVCKSLYFIGVDVGTGSVRAAIFDEYGHLIVNVKKSITMFTDNGMVYEQSSEQIWVSVCHCIRQSISESGVRSDEIVGIGFDATCSLVVIGQNDAPLAVGKHGISERNIIVWMDQRATEQAARINKGKHTVLDYVGQRISPEMETPKLLWLKENLPETYNNAVHFFDLTDYLSWRATGALDRSLCTTVCKWTYLGHQKRWDDLYFKNIGLGDLVDDGYRRIGQSIVQSGTPLKQGLTDEAALQLGLTVGTPVAAGLIDAHAGGIGSVGSLDYKGKANPQANMAYVFGTSACTMTTTVTPKPVVGVWGPYFSAMIPEMWLNEAGQSAAGAAIDYLVTLHPAHAAAKIEADKVEQSVSAWLATKCQSYDASSIIDYVGQLHVVPEFLGNRSPLADPDSCGLIAGIRIEPSLQGLIKFYLAGICGLGYGLRQIINSHIKAGISIKKIVISGGAGKNPLIRQIIADTTQLSVVAPYTDEPVLLGSAIIAAVAAGRYESIKTAMVAMSKFGDIYEPTRGHLASIHDRRYEAYIQLQKIGRKIC